MVDVDASVLRFTNKLTIINKIKERALCQKFIAEGMDKKEAMRKTAKTLGISRREVYKSLLAED